MALSLGQARGRPAIREHIILPSSLFPGIEKRPALPNTLYSLYQTEYGINIVSAQGKLLGRIQFPLNGATNVAFGGSDIAAGSTGRSRRMQNNSAETTKRIGIAASRRRAISLATIAIIWLGLTGRQCSRTTRHVHCRVCGSTQPLSYFT